jgi:D-alanine transfer protein
MVAFGVVAVMSLTGYGLGTAYIRSQIARSIHRVAPQMPPAKNLGVAMIREGFRHPDLLPAFGSSELVRSRGRAFYGPSFFQNAPTGFVFFPVATLGATPLNTLLRVAAEGPDLRGKKVVVSFTPSAYISIGTDRFDKAYLGNFSPLQANALAFNTDLSPDLTRDLAGALLKHSVTLNDEPLLSATLRARASGTLLGQARFIALYPLGRLQELLYRMADDFLAYRALRATAGSRPPPDRPAGPVDWAALTDSAQRVSRARASNNSLGMENKFYNEFQRYFLRQKGVANSQNWLRKLDQGYGWPDLDLLLRLLRERGARALIVCTPQPGVFDDFTGLPDTVRQRFYDRFRAAAAPYGFPVETFERFDMDTFFLNDPDSHFSPKGWLYYDRLVDSFYHDSLQ